MSRKIIGATVGTPLGPDGIREKLNPVTTINGVEPDKNGNATIEIPKQVQANLDQNDPNAPDYVKGKTHGVASSTTWLKNMAPVVSSSKPNSWGGYNAGSIKGVSLTLDTNYVIDVSGVEYKMPCRSHIDSDIGERLYVGNASLGFDGYVDDGGLFLFIKVAEDQIAIVLRVAGNCIMSIGREDSVVVPLDEKFIPDSIARTANVIKTVNGNSPDKTGNLNLDIPECKVKTVNNIEPDETGNIAIDIPQGGGGVQGNLDQNDPTAPDYVKGRTHWVEEGESTVIVESQTIENFQCMHDTIYVVQDAIIMTPVIGDTYKITWDGQEYELTAKESQDGTMSYIGNDNYVNVVSGGDIPFAIIFAGPRNYVTVDSTVSDTTSHILSITHCNQTIHKIDPKFIPDLDLDLPELIGAKGSAQASEIFNDYYHNVASGDWSHAEGSDTTASGDYSHAEGSDTTASGIASHAEGANTTASGAYGHAEGSNTTASGMYSHAEGCGTIADSNYQHVQGKWNIVDRHGKYAHIVGNGTISTTSTTPSNAHTLDWEGNAWYQGTVECTAVIMKSPGGKRFKITVDDSGTISATEITE
jgi:hypothetical protein